MLLSTTNLSITCEMLHHLQFCNVLQSWNVNNLLTVLNTMCQSATYLLKHLYLNHVFKMYLKPISPSMEFDCGF